MGFFSSPVIYQGHLLFCSVCVCTEGRKEFCNNPSQIMQKKWGDSSAGKYEIEKSRVRSEEDMN